MPRISSKNQVTVPVGVLAEAGISAGDPVLVEAIGPGELLVRRAALSVDSAFGSLTGVYPADYLARLDAEEEER